MGSLRSLRREWMSVVAMRIVCMRRPEVAGLAERGFKEQGSWTLVGDAIRLGRAGPPTTLPNTIKSL
jgi:hypothetical protein